MTSESKDLYLPGFLDMYLKKSERTPEKYQELSYRPDFLMLSERITLANNDQIELLPGHDVHKEKQLGEISYIYGLAIRRIESYITDGNFTNDGSRIVIKAPFHEFTKGFTQIEKRDLIKNRDSFSKAMLYRWMRNRAGAKVVRSQEIEFFSLLLTREHAPDSRMLNLTPSEVGKVVVGRPCGIQVFVNLKLYRAVISYLDRAGGKHSALSGTGGAIPILRNSGKALKAVLKQESDRGSAAELSRQYVKIYGGDVKKSLKAMSSIRYRDQIRQAYEMIEEYLHRQNFTKKPLGTTASLTNVYPVLYPSTKAGNRARFFYLVYIFDILWNSTRKGQHVNIGAEKRVLTLANLGEKKAKEIAKSVISGKLVGH